MHIMKDILREYEPSVDPDCHEAADEIERLQVENTKLREALEEAKHDIEFRLTGTGRYRAINKIKKALTPEEDK
jgi:hypothetical protein